MQEIVDDDFDPEKPGVNIGQILTWAGNHGHHPKGKLCEVSKVQKEGNEWFIYVAGHHCNWDGDCGGWIAKRFVELGGTEHDDI